jgi:hypothetical protein
MKFFTTKLGLSSMKKINLPLRACAKAVTNFARVIQNGKGE